MKALISKNEPVADGFRIAQVAQNIFPVAAPMCWVDCDATISADKHHYRKHDGAFVETPEAQIDAEQLLARKKRQRKATVDSITVTVQSGKVFDGNEDAQSRMANCILVAGITGLTECTWILATNVPTTVTLAELQEALALSVQAMGAVWAEPYL